MKPKVSVVVPVYNTQNTIGKCLYSLLNQQYTHYEIICVDDGSSDGTIDVLNSFSKKNPLVTVVRCKHTGRGAARNRGIQIARGQVIAFTDADCVVPSDWLAKLCGPILTKKVVATQGKEVVAGSKIQREVAKANNNFLFSQIKNTNVYHIDTKNFAIRKSIMQDLRFKDYFALEEYDLFLRFPHEILFVDIAVQHVKRYSYLSLFLTQYERAQSAVQIWYAHDKIQTTMFHSLKNSNMLFGVFWLIYCLFFVSFAKFFSELGWYMGTITQKLNVFMGRLPWDGYFFVLRTYHSSFGIVAQLFRAFFTKNLIVYVGNTGFYNYGDDFIFRQFKKDFASYTVIPQNGYNTIFWYLKRRKYILCLGGGTLIGTSTLWLRTTKKYRQYATYQFSYGTGAVKCSYQNEWKKLLSNFNAVGLRAQASVDYTSIGEPIGDAGVFYNKKSTKRYPVVVASYRKDEKIKSHTQELFFAAPVKSRGISFFPLDRLHYTTKVISRSKFTYASQVVTDRLHAALFAKSLQVPVTFIDRSLRFEDFKLLDDITKIRSTFRAYIGRVKNDLAK